MARARRREKRGGMPIPIAIDGGAVLSPAQVDQVLAIDLALERLARMDDRKSRVFELRFFGGLSVDETANALGISAITVMRDWNFARAWLKRELVNRNADSGTLETD